jgi:hypothetical protein
MPVVRGCHVTKMEDMARPCRNNHRLVLYKPGVFNVIRNSGVLWLPFGLESILCHLVLSGCFGIKHTLDVGQQSLRSLGDSGKQVLC